MQLYEVNDSMCGRVLDVDRIEVSHRGEAVSVAPKVRKQGILLFIPPTMYKSYGVTTALAQGWYDNAPIWTNNIITITSDERTYFQCCQSKMGKEASSGGERNARRENERRNESRVINATTDA